jgi:hypothetical protein
VLRTLISRSDGLNAAGRPEEAVVVALDGLQQARRLGLVRAYGPVLAANATWALLALAVGTRPGWSPARPWRPAVRSCLQGLTARPGRAGAGPRRPGRRPGPAPGRPAPAPHPDPRGRTGRPAVLGQLLAEAVPQVEANPRYAAPIYTLGVRIEADLAELARARHPGQPTPDDHTATALLERVRAAAEGPAAAGLPELAAWHTLGLAEQTRQQGRPDPAAWT